MKKKYIADGFSTIENMDCFRFRCGSGVYMQLSRDMNRISLMVKEKGKEAHEIMGINICMKYPVGLNLFDLLYYNVMGLKCKGVTMTIGHDGYISFVMGLKCKGVTMTIGHDGYISFGTFGGKGEDIKIVISDHGSSNVKIYGGGNGNLVGETHFYDCYSDGIYAVEKIKSLWLLLNAIG